MSAINPYRDFVTLTGEIEHTLAILSALLEQHSQVHNGKHRLYRMRIDRMRRSWAKLPYPRTVENNNGSFV